MKTTILLMAMALPMLAQQPFDFKTLDKLGANAKESTNVNLDGNMLKMASSFMGSGGDKDAARLKALVDGLKGIHIRSFEFDGPGKYSQADLAPLRDWLNAGQWNKIVDVKSAKETSEIFLLPLPDNKLGGVAIISAEAQEVTVVYINGVINADDLGKLGGNMGIPDLSFMNGGKKDKAKPGDKKEE